MKGDQLALAIKKHTPARPVVMLIPGIGEGFVPPRIRLGLALLLALCLMPIAAKTLPFDIAIPAEFSRGRSICPASPRASTPT